MLKDGSEFLEPKGVTVSDQLTWLVKIKQSGHPGAEIPSQRSLLQRLVVTTPYLW